MCYGTYLVCCNRLDDAKLPISGVVNKAVVSLNLKQSNISPARVNDRLLFCAMLVLNLTLYTSSSSQG
jgi:hypothetical protein